MEMLAPLLYRGLVANRHAVLPVGGAATTHLPAALGVSSEFSLTQGGDTVPLPSAKYRQ